MFNLRTAAVAAAIVLPLGAHATAASDASVAFELRDRLDARGFSDGGSSGHLDRFYATRQGAPAWWTGGGWSPEAHTALEQMARADQHGLMPADYHVEKLQRAITSEGLAGGDPQRVAETELLLTRAVLAYLEDLANGRIDPAQIDWNVNRTRRIDPPSALQRGLIAGDFGSWMAGIGPSSDRYRRLRQARERYAEIAAIDWPSLPDGPTINPGDRDPRVEVARRQLELLEWLRTGAVSNPSVRHDPGPSKPGISLISYEPSRTEATLPRSGARQTGDPELYDEDMAEAIRQFQERQGLRADGLIGSRTRAALNVSPAERLEEIDLNLERLRWISDNPGDRYVMVNIPDYELTAYANGAVADKMNVIVGEPDWETPIFSDYVVDLKFAPDWTIPVNIVEEETLPKVRRDPGYLRRNNMGVYTHGGRQVNPASVNWHNVGSTSYIFRQEPGPGNALGLIRFSLTNSMGIYLHDTPQDSLFNKSMRALSHGCVRVERPLDLAAYLLDYDPSWDRARIQEMMSSSETTIHHLDRPTPVHFVYLTAKVDEAGELRFRDDIYDRNPRLREALERASSKRRNMT